MLPDPDVRVTVIAGRSPELYWSSPIGDPRIALHGFIADVRPFYQEASIVVVPTRVSAGTNLKVIEAMAMQRAVVSTSSGVNGISVNSGENVLIAESARGFAEAIRRLHNDTAERDRLAERGRQVAEQLYGWDRIGGQQRRLWREVLQQKSGIAVRPAARIDSTVLERIQAESHGASQWDADSYFRFRVLVAEYQGSVAGFLVSRVVAPGEAEVLNVAVDPARRNRGIATALLQTLEEPEVFLEVRESNTRAQALYRKLGFEVVGRRPDYYDDPVESAFVMRRSRVEQPGHGGHSGTQR